MNIYTVSAVTQMKERKAIMERFIKSVSDKLDRRGFFRKFGALGMGAAAAAALLVPRSAAQVQACENTGGRCAGKNVGDVCGSGGTKKHPDKYCTAGGKKKGSCTCE